MTEFKNDRGDATMTFNIRRFFVLFILAAAGWWFVADPDVGDNWSYFVSFVFLSSVFFICFELDPNED
ncbi:hypothetical protein Lepto7376_4058 [[Leptolyngbya] sp. PCC 7376]|uniref:hypothetical protein n=1 Tax=[Leptolyngbya] sp. PCC 7376 TaxID=111781 RepID=UPI00029F1816|nr:hypothetical protein [[Leptolyngbya] sp. PCC 7376]AFY40189.1 hypothetical protein Lepto7376_4058 [[Leptolyngbya] sp. PCC 7376]